LVARPAADRGRADRDLAARRNAASYTLFTGYFQNRVRGEMRSFQMLGDA